MWNTLVFFLILGAIFIICGLDKKINNYTKINNYKKDQITRLLRQTGRWAVAAQQDENPYIANLHATYAMGYLMSLRELFTDEEIYKSTSVDVRILNDQISFTMDKAIQQLVNICPDGSPKNVFLAALARGDTAVSALFNPTLEN